MPLFHHRDRETWYHLGSNTVFGISIVISNTIFLISNILYLNDTFGYLKVLSFLLIAILTGVYIYFTGPFPTSSGANAGAFLFVSNSLSIFFTIGACTYVHMGHYRLTFFIIVSCCLFIVIILSGYACVQTLTLKMTLAEVDEYIKSGYVEDHEGGTVKIPNFINYMQREYACCGGSSYQTYSNLTTNQDQLFWVPLSCCWNQCLDRNGKVNNGNLKLLETKLVYHDESKKGQRPEEVSIPDALGLWVFAYKELKESEKNGKKVFKKPGERELHYDIVKHLVSTSKVHQFQGQNYSNKVYWMSDQDAIPIKLFGCGQYLVDFENYKLGQPRTYDFIRAMRTVVKILVVIILLMDLFKFGLLIYCGIGIYAKDHAAHLEAVKSRQSTLEGSGRQSFDHRSKSRQNFDQNRSKGRITSQNQDLNQVKSSTKSLGNREKSINQRKSMGKEDIFGKTYKSVPIGQDNDADVSDIHKAFGSEPEPIVGEIEEPKSSPEGPEEVLADKKLEEKTDTEDTV